MREIGYGVRGFLTVRKDSLRVPLNGSLILHVDADSGMFSGDLVLDQSAIGRTFLGVRIFSAIVQIEAESPVIVQIEAESPVIVQIEAESPVIGGVDDEGRMSATVTVDAVIATVRAAGLTLISGGSCRTASHAVVPLRSEPGFNLERGGRLAGAYQRPPFTGCGWITPLVNLLVAGPGNTVVIDLIPRES